MKKGQRQVRRRVKHYNLDGIISVGYRVNSSRAVKFRQWATRTLREHLTRGWTLNQQRFEANARELEAAMALVRKAAQSQALDTGMGRGLVDIVARYAQTFLLPQRYDEGLLAIRRRSRADACPASRKRERSKRTRHQRCRLGGIDVAGGRTPIQGTRKR